ncbi:MAG: hypothetical protein HY289_08700, partial [Planctomycetes bacterium]|nr:hypothetical protein [Planctomycetota bacterium]
MRTPLDCHRHADLLARWKERLGGGALLLCVGWLATNLVLSEEGDLYSSRGPVTSVHRSWEAQ